MNSFFEGLGKKVSQTGQEAIKKTKNLAEMTKINSQIVDEEKKLDKLYLKLGQLYYQMHHQDPELVYTDICQGIGGCLSTIHRYEVMIDELRGIKRCERCKEEMPLSSTFCQACGGDVMNSFFEGLGKKVSQTGQEAIKKTKNLAEMTKINSQIVDEEKKLDKLYLKLGQLYYQMHHQDPELVYTDICQGIGGCLSTIHRYEVMIDELRGIKRCERCKEEMPLSSTFCQACGNKLDEDQETMVPSTCPDCGMENGANATTCIKCGKLL